MKYFKNSEFNDITKLAPVLLTKLDAYRETLAYGVTITSDWSLTGHSKGSEHYEGYAIDCTSKAPLWWQLACAEWIGFNNIGVYPAWNGLHLGMRPGDSRRWIGTGIDANQQYLDYNMDNLAAVLFKKGA